MLYIKYGGRIKPSFNIYSPDTVAQHGLSYFGIGRGENAAISETAAVLV